MLTPMAGIWVYVQGTQVQGIHPRTCAQETFATGFRVALILTRKKEPGSHPKVGILIKKKKKKCDIHTTEHYTALKMNHL